MLARYLAAHPDAGSAFTAWRKTLLWRQHCQIHLIDPHSIKNSMESGKAFFHKADKEGNPCLLVRPRLHIPSSTDNHQKLRFVVWLMERAEQLAEEATGKFTVLWDVTGYSYLANLDYSSLQLLREIIAICQEHYPERLARFIFLNASWVFRATFKLVHPLLSPRTQSKFLFLREGQLSAHFEADCLLPEHGGTSSFVNKYRCEEEPGEARVLISSWAPASLLGARRDGTERMETS